MIDLHSEGDNNEAKRVEYTESVRIPPVPLTC